MPWYGYKGSCKKDTFISENEILKAYEINLRLSSRETFLSARCHRVSAQLTFYIG